MGGAGTLWARLFDVLRTTAHWLVPYEPSENSLDPLEQRLIDRIDPGHAD